MTGRREFFEKIGITALSGAMLAATARNAAAQGSYDSSSGKKVRIGIIGAENSHSVGFGRIFNIDKKFPGVEVAMIWGETDEFAQRSAEKGAIPKIVKDPQEMLGKVDALIVDHRHPKYHVDAAWPFVEAGIPTFVDKPFSYRVGKGRDLLLLAEKTGTPITSLSSVGYGTAVDDMADQVKAMGDKVGNFVVTGPMSVNSRYGNIFFYGVHTVERMLKLFGYDVRQVRCTRNGGNAKFEVEFDSGRLGTIIMVPETWEQFVTTEEGMKEIKPSPGSIDDSHLDMYGAIVKMFQTGEEPRTHESILQAIAVLEAMERSSMSEDWELLVV